MKDKIEFEGTVVVKGWKKISILTRTQKSPIYLKIPTVEMPSLEKGNKVKITITKVDKNE